MSCKPLKISEMPGVHCLHPSDLLPIVRDGENRALTLDQLFHTFKELLPPPPHHGGDCLEAIRKACDALALANKALMAADQSYRIARDSWDLANTNKEAIVEINSQICEILLRLDALEQEESSKITIITNETDPKQIVYTFKDNNEIIAIVTVPKFATDLTAEDLSNMIPDAETVKIAFSNVTNLINAKYTKPEGGIPKSDLAQEVQTSLGKADTALQPGDADLNVLEGVKLNGNTLPINDKMVDITIPAGTLSQTYEANRTNTPVEGGDTYEEAIAKLDGIIANNEEVTAASLNDLNDKKANKSELADVAFSGDYNDLTNTPAIPEEFVQQQVDWNATSGVTSIANKPDFKTINGESIIGSGNIEIEAGGGTIDNIEVNGVSGSVENKIASVTVTGADVNVTGFTESEETNDNLEIQETDSVNDALSKLQKALIDDETVLVKAFNAIKDATGFSDELQYVEVSDTADMLYDIHDLQSADTKLASEIQNLKNREGKVNTFTITQGEKQVTYSPHYSGDISENKIINLLGADFINLTRELPPATNITVQEGKSSDYYTLSTAVRTIAEKPAGTVPMNPGIVYTWEESPQVWSTYQYIGSNSTAEEFRNTNNWVKRW